VLWFLFLTLSFPRRLAGGSGGCFLSPSVFFGQVVVKIGSTKPVDVNKTRFFNHNLPDMSIKRRFLTMFAGYVDKTAFRLHIYNYLLIRLQLVVGIPLMGDYLCAS
jgi:hypothetical protein